MIGPLIYIFIFYTHLIHNWLAFWHGSSASVDTRQWFAFFVLPKKIKAAIYYYSIPHTNTKYVISQFLSNFCHISKQLSLCIYFFNTCAFWTPLTHIIYIYLYIASLAWSWRGDSSVNVPGFVALFTSKMHWIKPLKLWCSWIFWRFISMMFILVSNESAVFSFIIMILWY